jgi:2,3-bisphosphoglycerate-independent phosphoglycerate mutase
MQQPKVILVIMDGWGFSNANDGNAINLAQKPNFNYFWQNYPHTLLSASGEEVGLPWGAMGSSEVGHLTIGSGRVIYQDLPRVTRAISDGTFYNNENFNKAIDHAIKNHSCLHLAGLVSAGGVHSHIIHIQSLLKLLKKQ